MDLPDFHPSSTFYSRGQKGAKGASARKAGPGLPFTASVQPDSRRGVCQPRWARPNGGSAKRDTDCPDIAIYQPPRPRADTRRGVMQRKTPATL